jgi:hypothetical protein
MSRSCSGASRLPGPCICIPPPCSERSTALNTVKSTLCPSSAATLFNIYHNIVNYPLPPLTESYDSRPYDDVQTQPEPSSAFFRAHGERQRVSRAHEDGQPQPGPSSAFLRAHGEQQQVSNRCDVCNCTCGRTPALNPDQHCIVPHSTLVAPHFSASRVSSGT